MFPIDVIDFYEDGLGKFYLDRSEFLIGGVVGSKRVL